jgi:carbamoyl-phosphate synthase large subunit
MMEREINVLFTSAGRRVELLRAFKRSYAELGLPGRIVAIDADPLAPALQTADRAWIVPPSSEPTFIPDLAEICRREHVALVFPLIDPDIVILARHIAELERIGTRVVVVPKEASEITADKLLTYELFRGLGLPTAQCWSAQELDPAGLQYPVFIKPRFGSAGDNSFKIRNERELSFFLEYVPTPIVQEFLPGPEITSDVVCDLEGSVLAVVSRRRIAVRAGEVVRGVSVFDAQIADSCILIAKALKAVGPITIQCMLNDGQPYFTEINARFGGGCPLAFAVGADAPKWLLAIAAGLPIDTPPIGTYENDVYLTRCDDSLFLRKSDLDSVRSSRF